jgi:pyruvate dehydrogenase E2 component (dihydrolipoamide acetyltransferase)
MAIAIQLPALSPTMKDGKITRWLKHEGDKVTSGTAVAECETDKSNLEIEAYDDGVLLKILVPEGSSAPVGSTIAWIGKVGEAIPTESAQGSPVAVAKAEPAVPAAPTAQPTVLSQPVATAVQTTVPQAASNERLRISPLAKKMAEAQGIETKTLSGSGPSGRIVKRDIEAAAATPRPAATAKQQAPVISVVGGPRLPPTPLPVSGMRNVIAQRLTEVKPGVPHFYLHVEIEMDEALKLREEAKAMEKKVSVNDILIKATAMAVRRFPRINQVFRGTFIEQLHTVDVGVAVAIEDGLITPMVRDADAKGLEQIAAEIRDLADRAKRKALKPEEYSGGSITVSNLGMFGIDSFIAVINPPHAAILAVGKSEPKVVVRDGQMVIRNMMSMTLSGDHRVIDGAVGAQFLKELKSLLERPMRLLF